MAKVEHAWDYEPPSKAIYGPRFLRELGRCAQRAAAASADSPQETFITCDVGQHQMWVAQHYPFSRPEHHLTSGGLGTMGYGLPAAIGAQLARPDARVINVTGDGSIMMNVQELATVVRYLDSNTSRPGAWAYPDMLEVGRLANVTEDRSHFGAWVIASAPLILSFDASRKEIVDRVWPVITNNPTCISLS